jgi:hypothetical protein
MRPALPMPTARPASIPGAFSRARSRPTCRLRSPQRDIEGPRVRDFAGREMVLPSRERSALDVVLRESRGGRFRSPRPPHGPGTSRGTGQMRSRLRGMSPESQSVNLPSIPICSARAVTRYRSVALGASSLPIRSRGVIEPSRAWVGDNH